MSRAEVALEHAANLTQLRDELRAATGRPDVEVAGRHADDEDATPIAVAAEVDEETLRQCVENHAPVWPDPPPDPIDVMRDAVKAMHEALAAGPPAPDLRKVMRDRLVPILLDHLDPILRNLRERRD